MPLHDDFFTICPWDVLFSVLRHVQLRDILVLRCVSMRVHSNYVHLDPGLALANLLSFRQAGYFARQHSQELYGLNVSES